MSGIRLRRIFWIGAAAILVAAALVAIAAILRGDFSDNDGRIIVSLAAALYTGGAGLSGLALADRRSARSLGRLVAAASPVALGLMLWGIWSFVFDGEGDETASKISWSAALVLLSGLLVATALLIARTPVLRRLAMVSGLVAFLAAMLSVIGVWSEPDSDTFVKAVAVLWILAALSYLLVPVLQRFASTPADRTALRVLAALGDVELVATRSGEGLDVQLAPGERLQLRRRG